MTNEFYKPGEQRAAQVGELFATIARRYDLINDIQSFGLHRLWKRRVLRLARVQSGERALDLCCGTGDLTLALAKRGAEVTGLDFSEAMLQVAREKASRANANHSESPAGSSEASSETLRLNKASPSPRGEGRGEGNRGTKFDEQALSQPEFPPSQTKIEFIRGDAQQIPFPENTFDILTVGYGLRNLADLETGLRDMLRVTKPGGRIVTLEFGKPVNSIWRAIYFSYLKFALPIFGKLFVGNSAAYAYILESLQHYPSQQTVAAKMAALGWKNIQIVNLIGGIMSIHYAEKPK